MSYILERFGTTFLPTALPAQGVNADGYRINPISLPLGGAADGLGAQRARAGARVLEYSCRVIGATPTALRDNVNSLRALAGKRAALYRRVDVTGEVQWVWARLLDIVGSRTAEQLNYLDLTLRFALYDACWRGARHGGGWTLDSGESFDTGLVFDEALGDVFTLYSDATTGCALTNGGDAAAAGLKLTITAGSGIITALSIYADTDTGRSYVNFTTLVLAAQVLVIDQARLTVLNNAVDARRYLVRDTGQHRIVEWLRLGPGATTYNILLVGGGVGSTALWQYYEGHT